MPDPFAAYGGQAHDSAPPPDPFAAYGGSAHDSAQPKQPEKPGFFKRLGQSVGIPTSAEELKAAAPQSISDALALLDPGGIAAKVLRNYAETSAQGFKQGLNEADEADQDLKAGRITTGQAVGKTASAALNSTVNAVPIIGPSMVRAGEDVAGKNYSGAAGGLTGVVAQVASPELAKRGIDAIPEGTLGKVQQTAAVLAKPGINAAEQLPGIGSVIRFGRKLGEYKDALGKIREIWLPAEGPQAPPDAGQVPTPQEAAPAAEQQSPGALTRLPSESPLSGESALRQILTGQDNANLTRIAKSRGINIAKESQLKPGVADRLLVNKIVDDFSPDELDEVGAKYLESSRFKHNFGDVGSEAWKSMSMQTYFPDVKLPAAMVKRVNAAIASAAPQTPAVSAVPEKAMAAAAANAPIPSQVSDLLRQSLAQRGIIVDANGNIIKR